MSVPSAAGDDKFHLSVLSVGRILTASMDAWYLWDSGPGDPAWNMAVDEVLLEQIAELGRPVLRFYGWTRPAATFGYFQHFAPLATLTSVRPLIRRPTGGGLVPHLDDWTYSVTVPPAHPWYHLTATASYQRIHEWLRRGFRQAGVATALAPCCDPAGPGQCFVGAEKSDLLWGAHKIAGAAQRRNRHGLLIQGSVQPPPPGLLRPDWQAAVIRVGPDEAARRFDSFAPSSQLLDFVKARAAERYASPSYNQRR